MYASECNQLHPVLNIQHLFFLRFKYSCFFGPITSCEGRLINIETLDLWWDKSVFAGVMVCMLNIWCITNTCLEGYSVQGSACVCSSTSLVSTGWKIVFVDPCNPIGTTTLLQGHEEWTYWNASSGHKAMFKGVQPSKYIYPMSTVCVPMQTITYRLVWSHRTYAQGVCTQACDICRLGMSISVNICLTKLILV